MPSNPRDPVDPLLALCALAQSVNERRTNLQSEIARGYADATRSFSSRNAPIEIAPAIPGGMLEALCIAGALGRDTSQLDAHYTRSMPALLARQLVTAQVPEEALFTARLSLKRMPRLAAALEALFARVASADLPCETTLGARTPALLLEARPTLGALYAGCHFGRSMPMLYAAPGDVSAFSAAANKRSGAHSRDASFGNSSLGNSGGSLGDLHDSSLRNSSLRNSSDSSLEDFRDASLEEWIDARYTGPLAHELSHLQPLDPALVPAPGNLHEALAAWLGSEAFPEQLCPRDNLDSLPGGAFFASVGAWLARTIGEHDAIRAQAGALDLQDALGNKCASALRLYGWLPFLETSAPHLLADTFSPARWWKLVDLHRDPALAEAFETQLVRPLLEAHPPPRGVQLVARWNEFLDALDWPSMPAWHDPIGTEDEKLALRACRALAVRAVRQGGSFRAERADPPSWPADPAPTHPSSSADHAPAHSRSPTDRAPTYPSSTDDPRAPTLAATPRRFGDGPLHLDLRSCTLRAAWPGPDAVGAPPNHPVPPSICATWSRAGFDELHATPEGLPSLEEIARK